MAHFTELGLSGEPDKKPANQTARMNSGAAPRPGLSENQPDDRNDRDHHYSRGQKTATVIGSLIATSLLGLGLFETSGCSKASDKSATISAPTETALRPALPGPAASLQPAAPVSSPGVKTSTRKPRIQRTLIASSYANPLYGVSFRYPKNYSLKEGDKANAEWTRLEPIAMNFAQPGGTTLTMVELPNRLYPGTDLASAFFTVSVNTGLSRATCGQFASSDPGPAATGASGDGGASPAAVSPVATSSIETSKAELLDGPSTEVDRSGDQGAKHADAKYYHVFENGACYEFALGFETTAPDPAAGPIKSVDRSLVFRKLNWMLSTVKIEAAGVPDEATQAPITPATLGKD
jgi:hypothetical protein